MMIFVVFLLFEDPDARKIPDPLDPQHWLQVLEWSLSNPNIFKNQVFVKFERR